MIDLRNIGEGESVDAFFVVEADEAVGAGVFRTERKRHPLFGVVKVSIVGNVYVIFVKKSKRDNTVQIASFCDDNPDVGRIKAFVIREKLEGSAARSSIRVDVCCLPRIAQKACEIDDAIICVNASDDTIRDVGNAER